MRWPFPIFCLVCLLLGWGCDSSHIAQPARYFEKRPENTAIDAAARCLGQKEDWADKAEYAVSTTATGWEVTAWRVEYPSAKGPDRYKPWGFRIITVARDGKVIGFSAKRS